jgi:hypothetical protein
MAMMKGSNKRQRDIQRVMHLIGAAALLIYVYTPSGSLPVFTTLMQVAIVPALGVSGLLMWQAPRLRKLLQSKGIGASRGGSSPATTEGRRTEAS